MVEPKIIIATYLAGRGTDIKISKEISDKGGLHVILTLLPQSERVQRQAFGRAARIGQNGTWQIIANLGDLQKAFGYSFWENYFNLRSIRSKKYQHLLLNVYLKFTIQKDEKFSQLLEKINNSKSITTESHRRAIEESFALVNHKNEQNEKRLIQKAIEIMEHPEIYIEQTNKSNQTQPNAMPSNSINNFSMETIIQINSQDNPYEDEDEEIKENPQTQNISPSEPALRRKESNTISDDFAFAPITQPTNYVQPHVNSVYVVRQNTNSIQNVNNAIDEAANRDYFADEDQDIQTEQVAQNVRFNEFMERVDSPIEVIQNPAYQASHYNELIRIGEKALSESFSNSVNENNASSYALLYYKAINLANGSKIDPEVIKTIKDSLTEVIRLIRQDVDSCMMQRINTELIPIFKVSNRTDQNFEIKKLDAKMNLKLSIISNVENNIKKLDKYSEQVDTWNDTYVLNKSLPISITSLDKNPDFIKIEQADLEKHSGLELLYEFVINTIESCKYSITKAISWTCQTVGYGFG